MRIVQICFQLHEPYELADFGERESGIDASEDWNYMTTEKRFRELNETVYQPLMAFLERNTQKYRDFKVSLQVSGTWLELAERYDVKLIQRLKKLVKAERIELVGGLYYHSLAFFWDKEEATEQLRMYRDKIDQLFGVKGRILAMPDLFYDDSVGKWAEENGFAGMMIAGEQRALGWRNINHVYEAKGCEYLRLLVVNEKLSSLVDKGDKAILTQKEVADADGAIGMRDAFVLENFVKQLDLATLRGGLVNLCWDARIFAEQRSKGVIGFLDDLVELLNSGKKGDKMVGAAEACVVEEPKMELSITRTVSRGDLEGEWRASVVDSGIGESKGLVLRSDVKSELPLWLSSNEQRAIQDKIYRLRREILASEDDKLIADFRRMLVLDYVTDLNEEFMNRLACQCDEIKRRAAEVKKSQAVEISRTYTKRRDRGGADQDRFTKKQSDADNSGPVRVVFSSRSPHHAGMSSRSVHRAPDDITVKMSDDLGENIAVRRVTASSNKTIMNEPRTRLIPVEAEVVADNGGTQVERSDKKVASAKSVKKHTIRKIIKRLVIE